MATTKNPKFSSILAQKIPSKVARALIYAFLEWILICLLLFHSIFYLFLTKFAHYFGLKPPCFLCSTLFSSSSSCFYSDIICEEHASEISKLGYCSNHRKLVEFHGFCSDCSVFHGSLEDVSDVKMCSCCCKIDVLGGSGSKHESGHVKLGSDGKDRNFDVGFVVENEDLLRNEVLMGLGLNPESSHVKLGSEVQERGKDRNFDVEFNGENEVLVGLGSKPESGCVKLGSEDQESEKNGNFVVGFNGENEALIKNGDYNDNDGNNKKTSDDSKDYLLPQHLEFYIDHDDYRLIPVDLVKVEKREVLSEDFELVLEGDELVPCVFDSKCKKNLPCIKEENEDDEEKDGVDMIDECMLSLSPSFEEMKVVENGENVVKIGEFKHEEGGDDEKMDVVAKDLEGKEEEVGVIEPNEVDSCASLECTEEETGVHLKSDEVDAETNEGVEEIMQIQVKEPCTPCKHETHTTIDNAVADVSTSSSHLASDDEHDGKQIDGDTVARDSEGTEPKIAESTLDVNVNSSHASELEEGTEAVMINESNLNVDVNLSHTINEVEEERIPDTPTSVESLHHLHKKLLPLGRRESATEESLDGSMISEHEGGDIATVVEKLKADLHAERKTLRALYKELEEERNAAAIAANQTMAMITRLQEEKATMQMEALQYQRMMEEQSEYDQEALQMMNELMVKREKEKQELEKELDVYRRKVIDYEERERIRVLSRRKEGTSMRSRNSSASCSHGEESDGLSIDLNHEEETPLVSHIHDENGHHQDTPADAVLNLQDSLASFEEERQMILEQLKVLEEKLFTLTEEEEENTDNMKPFERFGEENGEDFEGDSYGVDFDANGGGENGFSHVNGKHHEERRISCSMQKRLLPLFDATESLESSGLNEKDGYDSLEFHKSPIAKYELEKKRLAIEEEVDNVYERLQALEAYREFLKHCIGSLRKGDKGLDLLQEILQHLRDLKSVELQVMKNMDHCASV